MCRSSEPMWRAALVALLVLVGVLAPPPAHADDDRPPATTLPEPLPPADTYPTAPLELPATRLVFVSKDVGGAAETKDSGDALDVLLNANVLFAKDSAALRPKAKQRLRQIAALLGERTPGTVEITGYTDDLGSAQHGLVLSRRRAEAVRRALASGLAKHRVTVRGRGEADPLVPNRGQRSRAKNRRVQVRFRS